MEKRFNRKTFGFIIDFWNNAEDTYHDPVAQGIRHYVEKNDINLITFSVGRLNGNNSDSGRNFSFNYLPNKDLFDGFIILSLPVAYSAGIKKLEEKLEIVKEFPLVSIGAQIPNIPSVVTDNTGGFRQLIEHLIKDHGYKKFAFVSGVKENKEAIIRLETFLEILNENKITFDKKDIFHGDFLPNSGHEAVSYFYDKRKISPEVIVFANDNMAMGGLQELWNRGKTVPEDVAITGYDDFLANSIIDLPFTTVRQPLFEIGYRAAENLHQQIIGKDFQNLLTIPSEPLVRKSCGCSFIRNPGNQTETLSLNMEFDERKNSFLTKQKENIKKKIEKIKSFEDVSSLLRYWDNMLIEAVRFPIKKESMEKLLESVTRQISNSEHPELFPPGLTDRLRTLFSEFYVHVDVTRRLGIEADNFTTFRYIDKLSAEILENTGINKESSYFNEILNLSKINNCFLTLFETPEMEPHGVSSVEYCRINGKGLSLKDKNSQFPSRDLIPRTAEPKGRFELVVETLFEHETNFGFLIMSISESHTSPYEILRRRLSSVFETLRSRKELLDLNQKLQKEVIQRKKAEADLQQALDQVRNLSLTDELTNLYNRRGFLTLANQQKKYCLRENLGYILFYMDLDGLKKINDIHGHKEGDSAICSMANILKRSLREVDIIGRIGGDEFTVFIPKTNKDFPKNIISRIQNEIIRFNSEEKQVYTLSVSIGYCISGSSEILSIEEMMNKADKELYKEKQQKKSVKQKKNPERKTDPTKIN